MHDHGDNTDDENEISEPHGMIVPISGGDCREHDVHDGRGSSFGRESGDSSDDDADGNAVAMMSQPATMNPWS